MENNVFYSRYMKEDFEYSKKVLASLLGELIQTPEGKMYLVEIYSNGNVACVPENFFETETDYFDCLSEFHALSVKPIKKDD